MGSNRIQVYQNNVGVIGCIVSGLTDITGYDSVLTVKKKAADTVPLMSLAGTVIDPCTLQFNVTAEDSSLYPGDYIYDINLNLEASIYTVTKDVFTIIDGVKY